MSNRKSAQKIILGLVFLLTLAALACRLTSPTPAAWSRTPTAEALARTNTAMAQGRETALADEGEVLITRYPTATAQAMTLTPEPQFTVNPSGSGPWLVYADKEAGVLHAFDVTASEVIEITLPKPIYFDDLLGSLIPGDTALFLRAGSPLNTDELGLYRVDLPSAEITKLSPLLSIGLQRRIVNEQGTLALETLEIVTRPDGLAWSPDGRFLAFTAALDNNSSDLYVYDTTKDRIERLNGLYTQNATPFWAPGGNWLVTQELWDYDPQAGWRAEHVMRISVPGFVDQNILYLPGRESQSEVFLGWVNTKSFISYSQTSQGPELLRQVNIDSKIVNVIYDSLFKQAAFDPLTGWLAFTLTEDIDLPTGMTPGVYVKAPDQAEFRLERAGDWDWLDYEPGGLFIAKNDQGLFAFTPDSESMFLPGEGGVSISPQGNWMITWGDGANSTAGARLYQPPSSRSLQTITEQPVQRVLWQADSKGFFLLSEGTLYQLLFPGLVMTQIEKGFTGEEPLELIWVE